MQALGLKLALPAAKPGGHSHSQKSTAPLHPEKHIIIPPLGIVRPLSHSGKKQTSLLPKGAR